MNGQAINNCNGSMLTVLDVISKDSGDIQKALPKLSFTLVFFSLRNVVLCDL